MATVQDILTRKGSGVVALPGETTVRDAAKLMKARGIGSVMVTEGNVPVGIFTERDVLRRVVAAARAPESVTLREVMTSDVITVPPSMHLDQCAGIMKTKGIRPQRQSGESRGTAEGRESGV